jgi:hypothetical protein
MVGFDRNQVAPLAGTDTNLSERRNVPKSSVYDRDVLGAPSLPKLSFSIMPFGSINTRDRYRAVNSSLINEA